MPYLPSFFLNGGRLEPWVTSPSLSQSKALRAPEGGV